MLLLHVSVSLKFYTLSLYNCNEEVIVPSAFHVYNYGITIQHCWVLNKTV